MIDLLSWHPPAPETEAKWRTLGTRPLLTVEADGLRHTISRDAGLREGRLVALDANTDDRVYVIGHAEDDALDVALATPIARTAYRPYAWSPPTFIDADDRFQPPTRDFGNPYEADDALVEKDFDDLLWVDATQKYYDLDTGYGPVWVRNPVPPIEAIAGLLAAAMAGESEVDIEEMPDYALITIGPLSIKAPPLCFGPSGESISTIVARLTHDVIEMTFLEDPQSAAHAIGFNSVGFWHWFARVALSHGLRALFVSERNPDTLTLRLDSRCSSGDDGSAWGVGSEPLVP